MFYTVARFILSLLFKIFFRLRVYGRENFPINGPVIVAPNHVSFLDPMIVSVGAPRKLVFLARDTLFRHKLFAKILNWVQTYPLKREGSDLNAFRLAINKLSSGNAVLVFPEGTRSRDGNLQEPKAGIGFLQTSTAAAILPCYVRGSVDAWPRHARFPRFCHVSVYFGKPVKFSKDTSINKRERYTHIAGQVMAAIKELKENAG